jgi:hypothetical protein
MRVNVTGIQSWYGGEISDVDTKYFDKGLEEVSGTNF